MKRIRIPKLRVPKLQFSKNKASKNKKHKRSPRKAKGFLESINNLKDKSFSISRRLREVKIRKRLIAAFVIILVIPIISMSVFSSIYSKSKLEKTITDFSSQEIQQISKNISGELDEYKSSILDITTNKQLQNSLQQYSSLSEDDKKSFLEFVKNKFSTRYDKNNNVSSYAILAADKSQLVAKNIDVSSLSTIDNKVGQITINLLKGSDSKYYINFYRNIASNSTLVSIGYMCMNLDENSIYNIYKDNVKNSDSSIFIIDSKGTVISGKNKADIGKKYSNSKLIDTAVKSNGTGSIRMGSKSYYISYSNIDNTDWHVVSLVPTSYINNEAAQIIYVIIGIAVLIFLIAMLVSLGISHSISAPLNKLMKAIEKAKEGNFDIDIQDESLDEIGAVNRSFNDMIGNISLIIKNTKNKAESVLQGTKKISLVSQKSFKVSEDIASTMNEVAKGASDQADGMTKSINYIGELSDGINQMEQGVKASADIIHKTNVMSQETRKSIAVLKDKSQATKAVTSGIAANVKMLSDSMKEIEEITKVMVDLSEHTNLLALNAAIEAARAGEAGKGFNVVSEEVRNLAEQSRSSSVKISKIIGELKEKVENIVKKASSTSQIISAQESAIEETSIDIDTIMEDMKQVDSKVEDILRDIDSISELKEKTSAYIEDISAVSEETAAITEEVTATSQEQISDMENLAEAALKLEAMVKKLDTTMSMFIVK